MEIKFLISKSQNPKPDIRYLNEMKGVLYDKKWLKTASNFELYYMYRGVKRKNGLRYDITVIPPRMLGKEFIRTKGHKHINNEPELFKVLEGRAIFLLQKMRKEEAEDIYAVKAKKNNVVIIPRDYGHITINPSKKELKVANWISEKCKSDFEPVEKRGGLCYFYTKNGWLKNKNYKKIPELRFEKPLKKMPENLDFLRSNT